jgi:hypothetical protein
MPGTMGLSCGRLLMDVVGVSGPVARGVATGRVGTTFHHVILRKSKNTTRFN